MGLGFSHIWPPKVFSAVRAKCVPAIRPTIQPLVRRYAVDPKDIGRGRDQSVFCRPFWLAKPVVRNNHPGNELRENTSIEFPDNARLVQIRGPVEPGLMFPTLDLAPLSCPQTPGIMRALWSVEALPEFLAVGWGCGRFRRLQGNRISTTAFTWGRHGLDAVKVGRRIYVTALGNRPPWKSD